ncbi:MAG: YiiX/YebB-like N1pC/P60 family cysteine hydrolase [Motiliproteus sp.]
MQTPSLDQLEQQVSAQLQQGDILFISIDAFLYKQVARGTGSWCSHVGFAVEKQGQWLVLESKVPKVAATPLRDFLARTCNAEVTVRRLKQPLTDNAIERLKQAASKREGCWYHLGFNYDSPRQFCSKFVHQVFHEALDVELGEVQTLQQLLAQNPQASVGFWRTWYLGFIPWQRRTITPASQLVDPQLDTVFSTVEGADSQEVAATISA